MLMDQTHALRIAKLMKLQPAGDHFAGRLSLTQRATTDVGDATLEVSWHTDGSTAAPRGVLIQSARPVIGAAVPEFYATWVGFTQAYGVRLPWHE